jgi:hypothetical protein
MMAIVEGDDETKNEGNGSHALGGASRNSKTASRNTPQSERITPMCPKKSRNKHAKQTAKRMVCSSILGKACA